MRLTKDYCSHKINNWFQLKTSTYIIYGGIIIPCQSMKWATIHIQSKEHIEKLYKGAKFSRLWPSLSFYKVQQCWFFSFSHRPWPSALPKLHEIRKLLDGRCRIVHKMQMEWLCCIFCSFVWWDFSQRTNTIPKVLERGMIKKVLDPLYLTGYQGMKIWPLLFNIISLQCNALSPSLFQKRRALPGPASTRVLPESWLLYDAFIASILSTMKMWF